MPARGWRKPIEFEISASGCFECTSHCKDKDGYPVISINSKQFRMNRFIYAVCFGDISEGLVVRHKCDNRACINPEHLELGTVVDNNRDRHERGRSIRSEDARTAKLTREQVQEIRESNLTHKELHIKYGVSLGHVYKIKNGKIWKF
jgi:hypothetical protein